jgi:uncharacterized membrane protein HdeD (DUF308 family)
MALLLLAGLLSIAVPFFAGIAASVFFGWLMQDGLFLSRDITS